MDSRHSAFSGVCTEPVARTCAYARSMFRLVLAGVICSVGAYNGDRRMQFLGGAVAPDEEVPRFTDWAECRLSS